MEAIDERLAHLLGDGPGVMLTIVAALLLGLRHATDPDHLTAVSTLTLSDGRTRPWRAARLGAAWGLGHASTLVIVGTPMILLDLDLPEPVQRAAEITVGAVIIVLAVRLLVRWRHGYFHTHAHEHDGVVHSHPHLHDDEHPRGAAHPTEHGHAHDALGRSPRAAYGIGLIHGLGGSAAVVLLLLGAISDNAYATTLLVVFAVGTALSMSLCTAAFGTVLSRDWIADRLQHAVLPLAVLSLAFGTWYALSALQ